ncbi:hypothetical protein SCB71_21185 (plasmid) [Herbiconiux sp. KACC 21604]|uniref:hypothetical protein n=1 Tax=unclassified Herbiconiux TaxID=2618217 RepID=UPI001491EB0E|nr:hypothetical protein [Herbiconiux sp. SALV-R1]QJU56259.1 hypothetical protein HL652_20980 [Herbiconiux sp. SALV-R1]WPO88873.1 hypothetical protein SCB71_21185 [Herbiconiux sp. KACC 21604]
MMLNDRAENRTVNRKPRMSNQPPFAPNYAGPVGLDVALKEIMLVNVYMSKNHKPYNIGGVTPTL